VVDDASASDDVRGTAWLAATSIDKGKKKGLHNCLSSSAVHPRPAAGTDHGGLGGGVRFLEIQMGNLDAGTFCAVDGSGGAVCMYHMCGCLVEGRGDRIGISSAWERVVASQSPSPLLSSPSTPAVPLPNPLQPEVSLQNNSAARPVPVVRRTYRCRASAEWLPARPVVGASPHLHRNTLNIGTYGPPR